MRPSSAGSKSSSAASGVLEELPQLERSAVVSFLEEYGYIARDSLEWWESPVPELTLQVKGHEKMGKHSYYQVECALAMPGQWQSPFLTWRSSVRLTHFRTGLHDHAKRELGDAYKQCFDGVHFAHRYALNGTTSRLDAWCRKLASSISSKLVSPFLAAFTLQILCVPSSSFIDPSCGPRRKPDGVEGQEAQVGDMASQPVLLPDGSGEEDLNPFSEDVIAEEAARPHFAGSPLSSVIDPGSPMGFRSDAGASGCSWGWGETGPLGARSEDTDSNSH